MWLKVTDCALHASQWQHAAFAMTIRCSIEVMELMTWCTMLCMVWLVTGRVVGLVAQVGAA